MKLIPSTAAIVAGLMIAGFVSGAAILTELTTWSLMLLAFASLGALFSARRRQPVPVRVRTDR